MILRAEDFAPRVPPDFVVGLDLGQSQDWTALVVVERGWGPDAFSVERLDVRHLDRFPLGTTYVAIAERVAELLASSPAMRGRTTLVVDKTGVGAPVVDLLRAHGLWPVSVTITAGDEPNGGGDEYRVPKRDLVGAVRIALETGKLRIAAALPLAETLAMELRGFEVKLSATGHDTYNARSGQHDDLVLATAVAVWYSERPVGGFAVIS